MPRLAVLVAVLVACEVSSGPPPARPEVAPRPVPPPAPPPLPPPPPPPAPKVTGDALHFIDRRGDIELRHGEIFGVGVSGNGRFAASASGQGTAAAWDLATGRMLGWIDTPHRNVSTVAISSDGARLATSGWDGTTRMWDVARGRQLWESTLDADRLQFTPDGRHLVGRRFQLHRVWSADGRLLRQDAHDGIAPERGFAVSDDATAAIALESTGMHELSGGGALMQVPDAFAAVTQDVVHGKAGPRFVVGDASVSAIALAPGADRIAAIGGETLDLFSAAGKPLGTIRITGNHGRVPPRTGVLLAADPRHAVTWDDQDIVGWDIPADRELWRIHEGALFSEPQLAGGDVLITSADGHCTGRHIASGKLLWRRGDCAYTRALPSTTTVVLHRGANAIDAIDARTGRSLMNLPPPTGPLTAIEGLVISSDGQRAVGHAGVQLWTWDAAGAHRLVDPPAPLWHRPVLSFLATGRLAVVSGPHLHHYDVDRNAIQASSVLPLTRIIGSPGVLFGARVILDEVHERGPALTIFDLAGREAPRTLPAWIRPADRPRMNMRNESLQAAVADPVAQRMFVCGEDTRVHAWDLRTGRLVAHGAAPCNSGRAIVLTPDRKHLIVPRDDGTLAVLDAARLREERRLHGPAREVIMGAVSPDGALVAASALDGLYLWRLADGARVATVDFTPAHEVPRSLAFAPDGATLWVGTDIGTMLRFRVGP